MKSLCLCAYLLQVSHRIKVDMLQQVFPGEYSLKTQTIKYYSNLWDRILIHVKITVQTPPNNPRPATFHIACLFSTTMVSETYYLPSVLYQFTRKLLPSRGGPVTGLPSSEVLGNSRSAAEQVRPQRLKLLTETQDGVERLAVFIQTWVELLDIQQGFLINKFQELLGLFRYLTE